MFITTPPPSADFVIVGGGTAGLSLASRLSKRVSGITILVIEAGPDPTGNPLTETPFGAFAAAGSDLDWSFRSTPQTQLGSRVIDLSAGKVLSGATAINYGLWLRGPAADYDRWAELVGDPSWSYKSLLPYFRGLEKHFDAGADPEQHGFDGPMHTTSVSKSDPGRRYPLLQPLEDAWKELETDRIADYNAGHPLGLGELVENWKNGKRQPASQILDLSHVHILLQTTVHRVIVEDVSGRKRAVGVQLANHDIIRANKEVIVSTGAYRTPQVLMLSGIGPAPELRSHGITVQVDNPEVGRNYHDHYAVSSYWKVHHPERGMAAGHPSWFQNKAFEKGQPYDFLAWHQTPQSILQDALAADQAWRADGGRDKTDPQQLLAPNRVHTETVLCYAPVAKMGQFPFDGTIITSSVLVMQPTSRGVISLASSDPEEHPLINCNFYATASDRAIIRNGMRQMLRLMQGTQGGRDMVDSVEIAPEGYPSLRYDTAEDEELDARARLVGHIWNHPAGTAAMGTVVDSKCCVIGIDGLRVVDASVLPLPISAHYMVAIYALGERVADFISNGF